MRNALTLVLLLSAARAYGFCGFYVAKGDAKLFNRASQVVLVHDSDKTVMTMANDFQGDPKEFAVVIPVPTKIERGQIHVAEKALIDHVDAYSAPRLVEYYDGDPCFVYQPVVPKPRAVSESITVTANAPLMKTLGVTIEARYTVGEYDILILSAKQSDGLEIWLRENGYTIPNGAAAVLDSYIKQHMHFFVAKVNLNEKAKLGYQYLRPLQVAYDSPKFMLPIRLGTVNANGPQELFVYTITRNGRVETTNYRTVKLPSDQDVPLFVKNEFGPFYKALFAEQVHREDMRTVFLEYAWNSQWCDPCASEPLSNKELHELGVWWASPGQYQMTQAFVTRLHVRYDRAHFPEDLVFQETGNTENFQARYILHHPWTGDASCPAADQYRRTLRERYDREAENAATLTGWKIGIVRKKMNIADAGPAKEKHWWASLW
jgi:hypothetical protein